MHRRVRPISREYKTRANDDTYIVPPAEVIEGDGVDVLVEDESERDDEIEDGESFGAEGEGENFDGVGDDEGGKCEALIQA